jgi:hypothetical protein
MSHAGIELGGIEYITDDRDGQRLYYDINALSNFVADPERIVGFNPYSRLAEYLIAEAEKHSQQRGSAGGEPAKMPALPGLGERV